DLETRSLLQVLYFVSHGVDIPPEHVVKGLVTVTVGPDGEVFDWQRVVGGLFRVNWACSKKRPEGAAVAIQYAGYWFWIDATDQESKATFSLLLQLSRLDVAGKTAGPLLTIPIGGR